MSGPAYPRSGPAADTRPRILHVVDGLDVGGLEIVLESLIDNRSDEYDHQVCAIRRLGMVAERLEDRGTTVHLLGRSEGADRTVIPRLARLIWKQAPQIVHAHSDGATDALVAARLAGLRTTVFTEHGWLEPKTTTRRLWVRRVFLTMARRVVAVSDHFAQSLRQEFWVPSNKIRVIRNSVAEMPAPTAAERAQMRAYLGVADGMQLIGAVGTMRPIKNFMGLLAAFASLAQRCPEVRLLIVGDGPQQGEIEAETRRLGLEKSVFLVGRQANVRDYLAALDVFVVPSDMEGTSLALLEACWCGLPIVATATGGNPEVVESGTTGTLVPCRDTAALAAAIERYLVDRDRASEHGANARTRVRSVYSFEQFLDAHDSLYQELL